MERPARKRKPNQKGEIAITPYPALCGNDKEAMMRYKSDLWIIIKADPLELFWHDNETGLWRLRKPDELSYSIRGAVKSLHRNKEGNLYYELHDKNKAMDDLCTILLGKGWKRKGYKRRKR